MSKIQRTATDSRLINTSVRSEELMDLSGALVAVAKNVEQAFIEAGAQPGKDYTYKDLMTMAMQFVCRNKKTNYSVQIDDHKIMA